MNNTDNDQNKATNPDEYSYGGFQYKRKYEEYKKDSPKASENGGRNGAQRIAAIAGAICFSALLIGLSLFVANTILQTRGLNIFSMFSSPANAKVTTGEAETDGTVQRLEELMKERTVSVSVFENGSEISGRGVILTDDGYIATESGLASKDGDITVKLYDGNEYQARFAGGDGDGGISVIKINASSLPSAEIGVSGDLKSGESVYVIGSDEKTVLTYKVKSIGGELVELDGSPDVPGCPVVNGNGEVVAITVSSKEGRTAAIDAALPLINTVINSGEIIFDTGSADIEISYLNVTVKTVTAELSEIYGIPVGCLVASVSDDSVPLKRGDIIVEINGGSVSDADALGSALSENGNVELKVYRKNGYITVRY